MYWVVPILTPFIVQALFVKIGEPVITLTSVGFPVTHASGTVGSYVTIPDPPAVSSEVDPDRETAGAAL